MPAIPYSPETALLVVDVQNDFADPSGSLYVAGGEEIVAPINAEIDAARASGAVVVLTQDWHPPTTPHFATSGGVWPVHCVRDTWGAELHPALRTDVDLILRKGTAGEDGYSAFGIRDPETRESRPTGLAGYLAGRAITGVVVVGLAADVCVKATALDGIGAGLVVSAAWDLTRSVDLESGDGDRAADELSDAGVRVTGRA